MKPIIMSTEDVRAVLDGRKTMTRQVVKFKNGSNPFWSGYTPDGAVLYGSNNVPAAKSPYQAGDVLWARETFLFLRVTDVRVERVQDILCGDMKREGVIPKTVTGGQYQQWHNDYFKPAWDARNAKRGYGWDSNPWVWVIEFERIESEERRKKEEEISCQSIASCLL